jgi:hypothetical protein
VTPDQGWVQCPNGCARPVLATLLGAHLRRDAGTSWVAERVPVRSPRPGKGSRNRQQTEGRGSARPRYKRPRGASPYR